MISECVRKSYQHFKGTIFHAGFPCYEEFDTLNLIVMHVNPTSVRMTAPRGMDEIAVKSQQPQLI